jgi:uncharacterized protein YqeY
MAGANDAFASIGLPLPDRLRTDLLRARRQRDDDTVSVIRTTLAAIANAEAPDLASVDLRRPEHPRLALSHDDLQAIVRAEIADREDTIRQFEQGRATAEAAGLERQLEILRGYLD